MVPGAKPPELSPPRQALALSAGLGLVTGFAAGLVGVGGGEFRIPVLLRALRLPVRAAAAINLVVGMFTVVLSLARRWGHHTWTAAQIELAVVMAVASLIGATLGPRIAGRVPSAVIRRVVYSYLVIVGFWMIVEAIRRVEHPGSAPTGVSLWILAIAVGGGIAFVSAALGVAGGEMRIPALMLLFALPIRTAGTVSLFVSVATVGAGGLSYRRLGHLPNSAFAIALAMAVGSAAGVLLGVSLLARIDGHVLKGILGAILLLATASMVWGDRRTQGVAEAGD